MQIEKRDGRKVKFDKEKIKIAVLKAFFDVDGDETAYAKEKARDIANYIASLNKDMTVEEIQNLVEEKLMISNRKDVARQYIIYRNNRTAIREKNTQLMKDISEKLNAKNVQNQNANVDEKSFGGRVGEASDTVLKKYALDNCMSEMAKNNHLNNEIYIHDLNSYAVGCHNCLSIPFDKLLAEGFNTRQTDVRPAQSVSTAFQLVAVIFQLQSLQQFGGVSATHLDWTMIPYVRKSFYKHYLDGMKYIECMDNEWIETNLKDYKKDNPSVKDSTYFDFKTKAYKYAMDETEKEIYQAVEGLYHNLNTLQSRSGNQLPFTSINYGTCTEPEGRMITKALLEVSIEGIGKLHKTSVFPCGIFQCMNGVNRKPEDPNYDLYRLALKSTAQRLYPNYANVDWSGNKGYDRNDPKTYFSTMGCVEGNEIITYKFKDNLYVESFKRMWNRLSDYFNAEQQNGNNKNLYLEVDNVKIYDTEKGFVSVKKVIRNTSSEWLNIKMSHGRSLICTIDHPFHTNRGRIRADELKRNDIISINPSQYYEESLVFDEHKAWLLGFILCDGCYDGHLSSSIAFDTENDIELAYIERMKECFDNSVKVIERHRGYKGRYKDLFSMGNVTDIIDYLSTKYEGLTKARRHIPNEVFSWNYNAKLSFLAGMIDADGYINASRHNVSVVQLGSTNKELALQQMALAQSLGMPCAVYQNHYSKKNPNAIRYRVEFVPNDDLLTFIVSQKKLDNYIENESSNYFFKSEINSIAPISNMLEYSYDVETESDHFEVSGIYSHNCRTANGWDINGFGQLKDGRGNICPVTIIMPTLAMRSKKRTIDDFDIDCTEEYIIEDFFNLLDEKIHEAKDMLLERFEWICSQSSNSAKFMYENKVMEGYDGKNIRSALKHGTLAMGQLGLAETLQILIDCDHTTEKGMNLAKRIEQLFKDRCTEFKEQYKLNFGVYYTPAENLCFTAMKKFQEEYGVIPKISDKKFFTNSIHVPVWIKMSPTEKIDIESQLTGYSSAGCITYVELNGSVKNNLDALESIVNYAMDKDIPYFAVNVPNDMCINCGYCDDINKECPMCGCNEIRRLRRVTGYLTGDYKTAFNEGKQQEVEMRIKHQKF